MESETERKERIKLKELIRPYLELFNCKMEIFVYDYDFAKSNPSISFVK